MIKRLVHEIVIELLKEEQKFKKLAAPKYSFDIRTVNELNALIKEDRIDEIKLIEYCGHKDKVVADLACTYYCHLFADSLMLMKMKNKTVLYPMPLNLKIVLASTINCNPDVLFHLMQDDSKLVVSNANNTIKMKKLLKKEKKRW